MARLFFVVVCACVGVANNMCISAQDYVKGIPEPEAMTPECLRCICEGSSGCKTDAKCDNGVCGPFRITRPYWLDSGVPLPEGYRGGPRNPTAYADCANNMECAEKAVKGYMKRYANDCNQDGETNCIDYASIHRLGPGNCKAPLDQIYYYKFAECYQRSAGSADNAIGPRSEVVVRGSIPTQS